MDLIGIAFSRDSGNRTVVTLTLVDLHISTPLVRAICRQYFSSFFSLFFSFLLLFFLSNISFFILMFFVMETLSRDLQGCLLSFTVICLLPNFHVLRALNLLISFATCQKEERIIASTVLNSQVKYFIFYPKSESLNLYRWRLKMEPSSLFRLCTLIFM